MRLSLIGFNALALAALVVPALLIYGSIHTGGASDGFWRMGYLVCLGAGVLFLLGAMAKLTGRRAESGMAITLMLLGLGLVTVPLGLTFVMAFR